MVVILDPDFGILGYGEMEVVEHSILAVLPGSYGVAVDGRGEDGQEEEPGGHGLLYRLLAE